MAPATTALGSLLHPSLLSVVRESTGAKSYGGCGVGPELLPALALLAALRRRQRAP